MIVCYRSTGLSFYGAHTSLLVFALQRRHSLFIECDCKTYPSFSFIQPICSRRDYIPTTYTELDLSQQSASDSQSESQSQFSQLSWNRLLPQEENGENKDGIKPETTKASSPEGLSTTGANGSGDSSNQCAHQEDIAT